MKKLLRKIYSVSFEEKDGYKITTILGMKFNKKINTIEYWENRVKNHGRHSVYNMTHSLDELNDVDNEQEKIYKEVLLNEINGNEKTALDFGCGCGRFEKILSGMVSEKVYAMDVIKKLLDLAPKYPKVEYKILSAGKISLDTNSIDLVFVSQVLNGITDDNALKQTINEFKRISSDNALFFIVENAAKAESNAHWKYRQPQDYIELFDFVDLKHIETFVDAGEEIAIMAGRKG